MNTLLSKSNCTKRIKRKMTKLITNRFQTIYLRKTVCTRLTMTHFDEKKYPFKKFHVTCRTENVGEKKITKKSEILSEKGLLSKVTSFDAEVMESSNKPVNDSPISKQKGFQQFSVRRKKIVKINDK